MSVKKVNKKRKVPNLKNIGEEDLVEVLRNNEISIYENELALLDETSFGMNLNELSEKETMFVFHFLDGDMINPYTEHKTKNSMLHSFIMTFDNHEEISKKIWKEEVKTVYTRDGEYEEVNFIIRDYVLYRKWSARATKYWNINGLNRYIDNFRDLLEGEIDRAEVLKDAIYRDAVGEGVSERVKLDSRRQMVDILGLKKERVHTNLNVFTSGGGRDMAKSIESIGGRTVDVTSLLSGGDDD